MVRKKRYREIGLVLILAVSIGICLAGCTNGDRAVIFDPAFSERSSNAAEKDGFIEENGIAESEYEQETVYVYVCGEVNRPGVYCLSKSSRIGDALDAAGGFTPNADTSFVNLAEKLVDGEKIYFPSVEESAEIREKQTEETDKKININTADEALLCTLPGIGAAKAADIVSYRKTYGDFSACEDIMNVPGIKAAAYSKIKDLITVK